MLKSLISWLFGITHGKLLSADPAKALNACAAAGVHLEEPCCTEPLTLEFTVPTREWNTLVSLAQKQGDQLTCLSRSGLPVWLKTHRKRLPLWSLIFLFACFAVYLPQRVLWVEIEGNHRLPTEAIRIAAQDSGLHFWANGRKVRNEAVKNDLLLKLPELQWAGVNFHGGIATVTVTEHRRTDPIKPRHKISDVISCRDAIIDSMEVLDGKALCKPGMAVRKGETLVTGVIAHEYQPQYCHADAEIYGLTQHQISAIFPADWREKQPTGRSIQKFGLFFGRKRINLSPNSGISLVSCDKMTDRISVPLPGGWKLPMGFWIETYRPYSTEPHRPEPNVVRQTLENCSNALVRQNMLAGKILGSRETFSETEGGYLLETTWSCREMIARQRTVKLFEGETKHD